MSIGKQLTLGFAALVVFLLALSYTSLTAITRLGGSLDTAVNRTAKKVDLVADVRDSFQQMTSKARHTQLSYGIVELERQAAKGGRSEASCSMCHAVSDLDANKRELEALSVRVKERIAEIRRLGVNGDLEKALDTVERGAGSWIRLNGEYLKHATGGKFDDAHAVLRDEMFPILEEVDKAATLLTEQQRQALAASNEEARTSVSSSRWIAFALIGLNLFVGVAVLWLVHNITGVLRRLAGDMNEGADQVAAAASQVSASSQSLAQGASEQAASLEQTSASGEEITAMTRKNADNSRSAAEYMGQVDQQVAHANEALKSMTASMGDITTASDKIARIIKVIDEIAFQTNILALNAAVEAARAGEAGMGFAVVADEVRNLAQRSSQAAKDTTAMIEESIAKSGEGSDKLAHMAQAVLSITESAARVKTLVDEVHLSSQEQARSVEQIGKAISQMQGVTQQSAANAEQSAAASEQLSAHADTMRAVVRELKSMVDGGSARPAQLSSQKVPAPA